MKDRLVIEKGTVENIPDVLQILKENSEWLASLGIKQWEPDYYLVKFNEDYYNRAIKNGELYVAKVDGTVCGTFTFRNYDLAWEDDGVSYFICNIGVKVSMHGNEIGKTMIEFAKNEARNLGAEKLKLDCVSNNEKLNKYFEDLGFRLLTTVVVNDRYTGNKRVFDIVK